MNIFLLNLQCNKKVNRDSLYKIHKTLKINDLLVDGIQRIGNDKFDMYPLDYYSKNNQI